MNNIYKSKWNESTQTWVACSELARGKCKSNGLKIVAAVALALASNSVVAAERPEPDETHITRTDTDKSYTHDNGKNDESNEANRTVELVYRTRNKSKGNITQNAAKYLQITTEEHYTILGNIVSQNTSSGEKAGELIIANKHGIISGSITNEGAGDIIIDNSFEINGAITSTETSTGNVTINNKYDRNNNKHPKNERLISSNITNGGKGVFTINNDTNLKGTIKNTGAGAITLNNNGETTGAITNEGVGAITLNNSGETTGAITNSGAGTIILNNSGTSTGNIINDSDSKDSQIKVTNNAGTTLDSTISNTQSGKIILTNQGTITKNITNSGDKDSLIEITNETNALLGSDINNTGAGAITLNNSGTSSSKIENTGDGKITLNNSGKSTGDIINASESDQSYIKITNNAGTTLDSTISNTKAGKIELTNKGTTTRDITNSGYKNSSIEITNEADAILGSNIKNTGDGKITLDNKGASTGNITNSGYDNSLIEITNEADAILGSNINNTGAGKITLNNKGSSAGDIINNSDSASSRIEVINNVDKMLESTISNKRAGTIKLTNHGITTRDITNSGYKNSSIEITNEANAILGSNINNTGAGTITLNNSGKSTGDIINASESDQSYIKITNNAGTTLESTISNTKAGKIELTNKGTTTGDITNSGLLGSLISVTNNNGATLNGKISNTGAGTITLDNKGTSTSTIKNTGAGTIALNNSGKSTGNIINDSDSKESQINVTNNTGATLDSTISNTKAGKIELTNKGTTTGDITNSGLLGSLISVTNNNGATLNGKISNTGAGTIKLNNTSTATFNGNLINTNSGTITATNAGIFTGTTNNANGKIDLDNQGLWIITGNSTLSQLTNTGSIKFPLIAEANAGDKNQYHTINIKEYKGTNGDIYVNTYWNNDGTSYADTIFIEKVTESGTTRVHAMGHDERNEIIGNAQSSEKKNTTQVINVESNEPKHKFVGTADISDGAKQAQLVETTGESGETIYVWSLTTQDPAEPIQPTPPKEVPIYAEPVSGYVQMPTVNMELGFTTIGTLHERRGENQTYNITGTNNTALADNQQQTWGRVLVKHLDKNGKQRLDTVGNQSVLQIGHDFILDENNKTGTRRHIGAYVSYGHNENDFRDQYRAENGYIVDDHYTGKGRTDAVSVGGYSTFYGNNGGYVDLVGQVSYLRNKYNARSNESVHQNGWGAALSAETGKSFTVYGNNWFVEPQAQLVYQYLSLDDFNDGIRHIDQHNPSALRGRVGMRFGYNGVTTDNLPPSSFYGIANIWHDFVNPKSVDIGRDTLKEEYAKTWGEVGVGIQLPITRQSHFYGDVRYEKNFGSAKRKGFKGTLGYKYTWL
jgi:outer membrane autotransporter protein